MCKNQQHIDMLEQFYNNIVEALKRAASEVLTNSPKQKHNVPGWNKDVREKHKATRRAYLYWIDNHKPKSRPLFDIMKESSDVVETVTSETETWLKFRDRDFVIKAETETWKFETETRDLTFL